MRADAVSTGEQRSTRFGLPAAARSTVAAAALFAVSLVAFLVVRRLVGFSSIDLRVYRVEGLAVRSHLDLYSALPTPQGLQATYPPFAALAFVPLTWLPEGWLPWTGLVVNLALLLVVVRLSLRFAGRPRSASTDAGAAAATLAAGAVALWAEPVFLTLRNGQINLALLVLVLWDVNRLTRSRWTGVGIGIAAGLKVTPALLIGYLLLTRRFRAAAVAAGTFAATIAVSGAFLPGATWRFWSALVFDSARVGDVDATGNQSIYGAVARITHSRVTTPAETALIAAVVVGGLACSVLAARRLGNSWGVAACSVTALLVAPIAWSHHWVWVVPVSLLLWQHARAWLVPVAAIFLSQLIWTVPHGAAANELAFSGVQLVVSSSYAAAGLAFLVAVTVRALRADTVPPGSGQDRMGEPTAREADGDSGPLSSPRRLAGGVHP